MSNPKTALENKVPADLDIQLQRFSGESDIVFNGRLHDGREGTLAVVDINAEGLVQLRAEYADATGQGHAWITIDREALASLADAIAPDAADSEADQEGDGDV